MIVKTSSPLRTLEPCIRRGRRFTWSFSGMSLASLDARTRDESSDAEIHSLLQQTERTLAGSPLMEDRVKVRHLLKDRFAPIFLQLQNDPAASRDIVNRYERIIVIDDNAHPIFNDSAISKYLLISQSYEREGIRIYMCNAR